MRTLFCPHCGARLEVGEEYQRVICGACKKEIALTSAEAAPSAEPKDAPKSGADCNRAASFATQSGRGASGKRSGSSAGPFGLIKIVFILFFVLVFSFIVTTACSVFRNVSRVNAEYEEQKEAIEAQREEILEKQQQFFHQ